MNKLHKVGLTALATSLVASSAFAGDLSVSGGASISYTGLSNTSGSNPWGMGNSVKFNGSGELDNGTTFAAYWELDNDVMDDYNMTFGLPNGMGTVKFIGASGLAGGLSTVNNIVPTAYTAVFESTDGDDNGVATSTYATNAQWGYTWTGDVLTASVAYNKAPAAHENSATHWGVSYTGMEGVNIVGGLGSDGSDNDTQTYGVSYTVGSITGAYQITEINYAAGSSNDETGKHYGISMVVNDAFSISTGRQETDFATGTTDEENTGYSASYTMGGMTIGYAFNEVKKAAGSATAVDIEASIVNLSFAF
jgi:outer membrane protein OmpU